VAFVIGTLRSVVLDCPDPEALAAFYAGLLGGTVSSDPDEEEGDWFDLRGPFGEIKLSFQRAPELREPRWPDPERPQQFHFDIQVSDLDAAQKAAEELGAVLLEGDLDGTRTWRVLRDPAGHPFCFVNPA
jgi:catechol 2,3-dioxygenase-like lactoylglutathione lyase family enzyme